MGGDARRASGISSATDGERKAVAMNTQTDDRQPGPAPADIKTAIIEDQRDIREGLTMLVNGTQGYACTGSFRRRI